MHVFIRKEKNVFSEVWWRTEIQFSVKSIDKSNLIFFTEWVEFFIHGGAFYDTSDFRITGPGRDGDFTSFFRGSLASSYARNDPAYFAICQGATGGNRLRFRVR